MKRKVSALAIAYLALTASAANAQPPFASFALANENTQPFEYTNTGPTSTFGLYGPNATVATKFLFQTANGYGASFVPIDALMTFTSEVDGIATVGSGLVSQKLKNISINFTAVTPVSGLNNLLTVYLSEGILVGPDGGSTLSIQATDPPLVINYQSDFLDFSAPFTNKNYAIAINTELGVEVDDNNYLKSFKSTASGNFASSPVAKIPEPGTLALLAMGAIAGFAVRRRK